VNEGLLDNPVGSQPPGTFGGCPNPSFVLKLAPSDGSWIESDLHVFQASDGIYRDGGIPLDSAGDLYGIAQSGGYLSDVCTQGCATVWRITQVVPLPAFQARHCLTNYRLIPPSVVLGLIRKDSECSL
jgi:hypothetical protein